MKTIYLAGGCFWGVQRFFDQFDGIMETQTGYANGPEEIEKDAGEAPGYRDVCDDSGHAETVKIVYDENVITLEEILEYYFMVIDPVSVNRQGHDEGIQYRTGIYYTDGTDAKDLAVIRQALEAQEKQIGAPLAVEFEPLRNYYPAEEYHQKYLDKNPGGYCHIPAAMLRLAHDKQKEE